ncbi:hypothetical protein ABPG77_006221 [Micractinium sp. CCAP 211/92]
MPFQKPSASGANKGKAAAAERDPAACGLCGDQVEKDSEMYITGSYLRPLRHAPVPLAEVRLIQNKPAVERGRAWASNHPEKIFARNKHPQMREPVCPDPECNGQQLSALSALPPNSRHLADYSHAVAACWSTVVNASARSLGGSASSASGSTPTFAQQQLAEQRRQVAAARAELAAANRAMTRSNSGVAGGGDSSSVPSLRHYSSAPACAAGDSAGQPASLPPPPPDFTAPDEFPMLGKSQAEAEGGAQGAFRSGSGAWAGELARGPGAAGSLVGAAGSGAGTWPLDGQAAFDVGGTLVGSGAMAIGPPPDVPAGMAAGSTAPAGSTLAAPAPPPDWEGSDDEADPADIAAALRQQQLLLQASWASGKACWAAPAPEPTPAPPSPFAGAVSQALAAKEVAAPALALPTLAGLAAQVQEERNALPLLAPEPGAAQTVALAVPPLAHQGDAEVEALLALMGCA